MGIIKMAGAMQGICSRTQDAGVSFLVFSFATDCSCSKIGKAENVLVDAFGHVFNVRCDRKTKILTTQSPRAAEL